MSQSLHFVLLDFTKHGFASQPPYFNMVRDPYARYLHFVGSRCAWKHTFCPSSFCRFKSRFNWHRADHPDIPHQSERCFQDLHMIEPDTDPRGTNYWYVNCSFQSSYSHALLQVYKRLQFYYGTGHGRTRLLKNALWIPPILSAT